MITVVTDKGLQCTVKPTIFPDGTSQVWKLPTELFRSSHLEVTWNFEAEREILDLLSLRKLLTHPAHTIDLHIPYLPYGRQDKEVTNESTFNLHVFADLVNSLNCLSVTTVDAHNPQETARLIKNLQNVDVRSLQLSLVHQTQPDYIVYPDKGAEARYPRLSSNVIVFEKVRNQSTGQITGHSINYTHSCDAAQSLKAGSSFLIVDDLCDGGATFISIAKTLRELASNVKIDLYITHGIFSRGREALLTNGINRVYTTNSLLKNNDGYAV